MISIDNVVTKAGVQEFPVQSPLTAIHQNGCHVVRAEAVENATMR